MKQLIPGVSEQTQDIILSILSRRTAVEEAILFGSRAKGNYKTGSDIDIAIKGKAVDKDVVSALNAEFEESSLIYFVDVIAYDYITSPELKAHIDRVGKLLFKDAAPLS